MIDPAIIEDLVAHGLIADRNPVVRPLLGGVSSDVLLLEPETRPFVLKRARGRLRVKDAWYADVRRNRTEQACLRYLSGILPKAVPEVLYDNPGLCFFCMEYLGPEFINYKELLLSGCVPPDRATHAGWMLGTLHRNSWNDASLAGGFDTTEQFWALRLEPYLITAGLRNPALHDLLCTEANRIAECRRALVHGDYSPKNILIGNNRVVILDCEVAWFGDPVFDVAFFLNHFMLKAIHLPHLAAALLASLNHAWTAYVQALGVERLGDMPQRLGRLVPMLMLARIDGKSPVEYLHDDCKQSTIRDFAHQQLALEDSNLESCVNEWRRVIQIRAAEEHANPIG